MAGDLGVRARGEGRGNLGLTLRLAVCTSATRRGRSWQAGPGRSERESDAGCGAKQAAVERGRGGAGRSVRTKREPGRRSGPWLSDALALGWATGEKLGRGLRTGPRGRCGRTGWASVLGPCGRRKGLTEVGLGCWVGLGFWVFWAGFPFLILTLFPISISNKV